MMRNQITYKYSNKHQHQQLDHFQNQHSTSSTHLARQQMEGNPINKNYISALSNHKQLRQRNVFAKDISAKDISSQKKTSKTSKIHEDVYIL